MKKAIAAMLTVVSLLVIMSIGLAANAADPTEVSVTGSLEVVNKTGIPNVSFKEPEIQLFYTAGAEQRYMYSWGLPSDEVPAGNYVIAAHVDPIIDSIFGPGCSYFYLNTKGEWILFDDEADCVDPQYVTVPAGRSTDLGQMTLTITDQHYTAFKGRLVDSNGNPLSNYGLSYSSFGDCHTVTDDNGYFSLYIFKNINPSTYYFDNYLYFGEAEFQAYETVLEDWRIGDYKFSEKFNADTFPKLSIQSSDFELGKTYSFGNIVLKADGTVTSSAPTVTANTVVTDNNGGNTVSGSTKTNAATKISVTGNLEEGTELSAVQVTAGANFTLANTVLKDVADKFTLFDINLLKNGAKVQPNGKVKVSIPIPEGYIGAQCKVYRIEADGTKTDMNAKAENGMLVFETDHFSLYAVAQTKKVQNPSTGNFVPLTVWVVVALSLGTMTIMTLNRKKKNVI